jgi:hypothetical protein
MVYCDALKIDERMAELRGCLGLRGRHAAYVPNIEILDGAAADCGGAAEALGCTEAGNGQSYASRNKTRNARRKKSA